MALVLANRVQETATPNTTVSFTLTGAVSGFQTFAVVGDTNTTYYTATDTAGNWEVGLGQYSTTGPTLTRLTFYASSAGGGPVSFPGNVTVFVTYPSGSSVYLDFSGNVSPLGTIFSGNWQASTVGVAYGGTGVTTSSGPNSVVLRDANENITVNRINQGLQTVTATGGTTTLTAASDFNQALVGTGDHTFRLPDATTLSDTTTFQFNNNATGTLTIENNAGTTVGTVASGGAAGIALLSNATVGGTWDVHAYIPENVTWGTNALALGGTVISGGTWQGGTIQSGYGGTGLTTFTGANNALYSTSASALTAGTLPVAAGGTGLTSFTANGIPYANSTTTLTTGSALTFDGTTFATTGRTSSANGAWVGSGAVMGWGAAGTFSNYIVGDTTSNYLLFQVNSAEGMRLTSTGLGIGTSTPGERLTVQTALTGTTAGSNTVGRFQSNGSGRDANIALGDNVNASARLGYLSGNMYFWTNGAERMRLDSSGNLGIGTSSPGAKLGVQGAYAASAPTTSSTPIGRLNNGGAISWWFGGTAYSYLWAQGIQDDGTNNVKNIVLQPLGGSIGIGGSPGGPLEVFSSGVSRLLLDSSGNLGLGVTPSAWGSGQRAIQTPAGAIWNFNAFNMTITQNAFSDGTERYIGNGFASKYNQNSGTHVWSVAASGNAGDPITFTQAMTLNAAGELLLGTTGASGNRLIVNGTIRSMQQGLRNTLSIQADNSAGAASWVQPNLIGHYWTGTQDAISVRVPSSGNADTASYDILRDGTHIWYAAGGSNNTGSTATERARIDSSGNFSMAAAGAITGSRINPRTSTTASTATLTPDIQAADQYNLTAQAVGLTVAAPIGTPVDGNKLMFRILDNGTTRTITWNATYTAIGVTLPTATTANKMIYVGCVYNSTNTRWDVIAVSTQA